MEELFIETTNGNIPIPQEIVRKYDLKKGTISPFSNSRIVGKNGEFIKENTQQMETLDHDEKTEDGIVEIENGILLSTSEMIDFTQATDSEI